MRAVLERVADEFGIEYRQLVGQGRTKEIALVRHLAAHILHQHYELSLSGIGRALGGRDHTTVLNSLRRAAISFQESPELELRVDQLVAQLMALPPEEQPPSQVRLTGTELERAEGVGRVPLIAGYQTNREVINILR